MLYMETTINSGRSRCAAGSSPAPASIRYLPGTCALDCTKATVNTDAAGAQRVRAPPVVLCYAVRTHVPMCVCMHACVKNRRVCRAQPVRTHAYLEWVCAQQRCFLLHSTHTPGAQGGMRSTSPFTTRCTFLSFRLALPRKTTTSLKITNALARHTQGPEVWHAWGGARTRCAPAAPTIYGCFHVHDIVRVQSHINLVDPNRSATLSGE